MSHGLPAPRANAYRDAWNGDLRAADAGSEKRVAGWVHRRRDHGGLIFIDLRDRTGLLQLVINPEAGGELFTAAEHLRSEHVITVTGAIETRDAQNVNPNMPTGEIELRVATLEVLATAETPPFPVDSETKVSEEIRLKHRAIDLRRQGLRDALILRSQITNVMRQDLVEQGFLEIETPILTRSTPEGARDFLVPSRNSPGSVYALPQSPQLFKQLLMMGGLERYYQIARCFRDEDLRADRQPEFTQLDIEMSFVTEDDVIAEMERLMTKVFEVGGLDVAPAPWPRMNYDEALLKYGNDRPDLRFGLEIKDISEAISGSDFKVFESVIAGGGVVRAINAGQREFPRKELDNLNEVAQRHGGKAVAWAFVQEDGTWRSPIAKFLGEERMKAANEVLEASTGDLLIFVGDQAKVVAPVLSALRLHLAAHFGLVPEGEHSITWIVDFPMFEYNEDEGRWDALHHPFTAPTGDLSDPGSLRSRAYDLVVDGSELGGGSIRINDPAVQSRVLEILGIDADEAQDRFGFLLDALKYGAPPHGGIAFGIDRIAATCAGRESIRDVIAFPKTATGGDPLTGAPDAVDAKQLRELGLKSLVAEPGAPAA
ncbi:MAG: aspartate--tRNA ligase [Solirubrobacteraceae bacterium]|nr:aspartate--tRNA ligase [Solirubrobacteraceae bacterium]